MGVDYEQLLKDNEAAKQGELQKVNDSYGKTASDYQAAVDKQTQALENFQAEQKDLQQKQTDFAIEKIQQQQEQAEKDYTKEQQAAYGDYKKQTDPYGVNAEQMAAMGLSRSGYSESSNVAMYTAYQNRVAAARASMEQAKLTFENMIQEAKLTNDINLAKIAQEVLEKKLALSMEGVIYLGNLEQEKTATLRDIEQTYYGRAQDIRDAQQAEIAAAREAELLKASQKSYAITGNEGGGAGATGNEDLTAVAEFLGDWNISDKDELQTVLDAMFNTGIITMETVNGVEVYKVADEEKARAYMDKHFGSAAPLSATGKSPAGSQTGTPKDTDEYTRMVEEYERLRDAYLSAQRTYDVVTKWGPSPQHKAALEVAKKAYEDYPVKINPEYEQQKKRVAEARAAWDVATSGYNRDPKKVAEAEKKLHEENEKLNNMKPYLIQERTKGMSDYVGTFRTDRLK